MNAIPSLFIENGMVSMTEADWRRHLAAMEDADDLAAARRGREALAADPFAWTLEESLAMIEGRHPIAVLRARTGMARTALATAAGVHGTYLASIENGTKPGSTKAMIAIARALGVSVETIAG